MPRKSKTKWEFGDFQTPEALANQAVSLLAKLDVEPQSIIEPTCGRGSFLLASSRKFASAQKILGIDINQIYLTELKQRISKSEIGKEINLIVGDFFSLDWPKLLDSLPEPILIVGNPPWVTSSELGMLGSSNVPRKSNFQKHRGYDAKTGKSNFDISEWMLLKNVEWLEHRRGTIAVLCKSAVARKVLYHAWKNESRIYQAKIFRIDAQKEFGASVDACFLVIEMADGKSPKDCLMYDSISSTKPTTMIGYHDEMILADVKLYQKWQHLKGNDRAYTWRSGIKHDCSKVMEIEKCGEGYKNGLGEVISLEAKYVYPMMKSSDIGKGLNRRARKYMLVTQRYVGDETNVIQRAAPRTWRYLENHAEAFERRGSSIYRDRPNFSIFGVGPYSFSPWKVAISGFYADLRFQAIGPSEDKAVVVDDTVYFLPCWSESEARFINDLLNSTPATEFYRSMVFWTDKRPITIEVLKRLNVRALSVELGFETTYQRFAELRGVSERKFTHKQPALWT